MADTNRGVIYVGPGKVEVQDLEYPKLELEEQNHRPLQHGVILKVIATNICGSDQHMVRGRTTAPPGQTLGHEITGEVIETGRDVEFIKQGDLVSVPFNIACGRCRNCKEGNTGVCENVNPARAGAAYGYVDMGGWHGGQARYVTVPYADWNLLKFPDRDQAFAALLDLAMLSDIFPTGYHGAYSAGVGTGSTVYVAGAGPIGLACASACFLLGAAVVIVGDVNAERLAQARSFGCETINLSRHDNLSEQIEQILGVPEVDAAVDCVGFEARGHGVQGSQAEQPATVLNSLMTITRSASKLGIPGLYVTGDPGAADENAKIGQLGIRIGLGWAKSQSFITGQCPVIRYNRQLMQAILHGKVQIARNVNATVIPLDEAPRGYREFDRGAARKYILDPHGMLGGAGGAGWSGPQGDYFERRKRPRLERETVYVPITRSTPSPQNFQTMPSGTSPGSETSNAVPMQPPPSERSVTWRRRWRGFAEGVGSVLDLAGLVPRHRGARAGAEVAVTARLKALYTELGPPPAEHSSGPDGGGGGA